MSHLVRYLLLAIGFALATAGLLLWQARGFTLSGVTLFDGGVHPVLLLGIGIAMIPPTLWEILLLERSRR
jgi:hypothetical protein